MNKQIEIEKKFAQKNKLIFYYLKHTHLIKT